MTTLWLDVDGVLLDYTKAFLDFSGLTYKGVQYENVFDYNLNKLFATEEECQNMMLRFAMSDEFARLPAIADYSDMVSLFNMGFNMQVITQLPAPTKSKLARVKNLSYHFGAVFNGIHFTDRTQCKLDLIYAQEGRHILVEDNPNLLVKADSYIAQDLAIKHETNVLVIAIRHPYNAAIVDKLNYVIVVNSFAEAAAVIAAQRIDYGR